MKLPSKYDGLSTLQGSAGPTPHETPTPMENWVNHGTGGQGSSKRKRGNGNSTRARRERARQKVSGSKSETGHKTAPVNNGPLEQILGWKGTPPLSGGQRQGRRTARTRQRPGKSVMDLKSIPSFTPVKLFKKTHVSMDRSQTKWNTEMHIKDEDPENLGSSRSSSEYDENNGQGLIDEEYDNDNITSVYNNQTQEFNEVSEYEDEDAYEQADMDAARYINEYSDEEGNDGPDFILDDPAATDSSSDFSN